MLKVFVWLQVVGLCCFCNTVDHSGSFCPVYGINDLPVLNILASKKRDSGAVETYIPDTETAFDWLNYHS